MHTPLVASGVQYGPSESGRNSGTKRSDQSLHSFVRYIFFSLYLYKKSHWLAFSAISRPPYISRQRGVSTLLDMFGRLRKLAIQSQEK